MNMIWTDINQIAESLVEHYPDIDPLSVRFTDLHQWILALPGFQGDPKRSNESILEAIQMEWINERD